MEQEKKKDIKSDDIEILEKIDCPDLENKFLLIRVGDNHRPASEEDISDFSDRLEAMFNDNGINCLAFVTHHAVSIEIIR